MKCLTKRGIRLSSSLREHGFEVIEVHPLTSGRILFGTKKKDRWVSRLLENEWSVDADMNDDEIDSAIAAITGFLYLRRKTRVVGEGRDFIVIPEEDLKFL